MYGGRGSDDLVKQELWVFDVGRNQWANPSVSANPPLTKRIGAAMAGVDTLLFIMGGNDGAADQSDIYSINCQYPGYPGNWPPTTVNAQKKTPPPSGAPGTHAFATAGVLGSTYIFLALGRRGSALSNSVQYYDTDGNQWSDTQASGVVPSARQGHSMVASGRSLYIFGGTASQISSDPPVRFFCCWPVWVGGFVVTLLMPLPAGRRTHLPVQDASLLE
jgi:N-acetylneuraminic acid mutarotase